MTPSGRYQSRFFSFLSQQSLKLRDKTSQTWRRLQVATAWGAQVVLYPIYLAFQTTRLVSRQLQQTVRQGVLQLGAARSSLQPHTTSITATNSTTTNPPLLTADTPILKTLEAIETLQSALPVQPLPASIPIQSLASLLSSRAIVLVTSENQVLDILTDDQQLQLQRRMIWEMAKYWQQQRSLHGSSRVTNFLPLPSDRPNALLPIRVFYRLMTWMQTSPIALSTNLFQETQLAVLHVLTTDVTTALPPSTHVQPQLPRSAALPWLSLAEAFSGVFDRSEQPSASSTSSAPSQVFRSSLRHRLQSSWQQWMQTDRAQMVPYSSPQPSEPQSSNPQTWLTWEDLFGLQPTSPPPSDWELFDTTQSHQPIRRSISTVQSPTVQSPIVRPIDPLAVSLSSPISDSSTHTELVIAENDAPEETALSTTWIEAEVKLVTYEKHPLEQVLEWLDRGMLWIEEKIANVVKWLRDRLNSDS